MVDWDPKAKASNWWYLAGVAYSIGWIIALIYVLVSNSKKKWFSLLYIITFIGPAIVYFVAKDEDQKLADLSKKLFIGSIALILIIIILLVLVGFFMQAMA